MKSEITVVITSVGKPRLGLLGRALASVMTQTLEPDNIIVSIDTERQGAAVTRQRGTDAVCTPLVAYLDDDDEMNPDHLELLKAELLRTGADLVFPWFDVIGGTDPFPMHEGKPWNNEVPTQFPITYLARMAAIRKAGGWATVPEGPAHEDGNRAGEDWRLQLHLIETGAVIVHLPMRTWRWHHDSANSSGLPGRIKWGDEIPLA